MCAFDEQATDVFVAAFAHVARTGGVTTVVMVGDDAKVGGKFAGVGESFRVKAFGNECGGGDCPYAGDFHQAFTDRVVFGVLFEGFRKHFYAFTVVEPFAVQRDKQVDDVGEAVVGDEGV